MPTCSSVHKNIPARVLQGQHLVVTGPAIGPWGYFIPCYVFEECFSQACITYSKQVHVYIIQPSKHTYAFSKLADLCWLN